VKAVRAVRERFARLGALLLAAGVAGLGLYGIRFDSALPERLPSPLDWRAAAARLARDGQPGDVVALAPWWAERARQALPASLPVLAFPLLAGEDLVGVRRVWLIALPAAPGFRRDVEEDLALRASAVEGPLRLGGLEVTRVDLRAPALPIAFLPDRLDSADVRSGADPCAAGLGGGFR
jgi:hypothetical protein